MHRSLAFAVGAVLAAPVLAQRVPDVRLDHNGPAGQSPAQNPDLAVTGDAIHVAWMDYRDGSMDVYWNRSRDGGRSWLAEDVRLDLGSAPGAAWSGDPRIAADGDTVVVCWIDYRTGPFPFASGVYCNRSLDGGATWLPNDVRIDHLPPGDFVAIGQRIAVRGDDVFVVWEDGRNGNRDIFFNRSADGGLTWLPNDVRLDTGDLPGATNSFSARLGVHGSDVHVAWLDLRAAPFAAHVFHNRSLDGGITWLPEAVQIDHAVTTYLGASYLDLAVHGDSVHVVWADNRSDPPFSLLSRDTFHNHSSDRGTTWQANDTRLDTIAPAGTLITQFVDVEANADGVFATWIQSGPGTSAIGFNRSLDGGATWLTTSTTVDTPPGNGGGSHDVPRLAAAGSTVLATWAETRTGNHSDVFFNVSHDAGSTWLAEDRRLDTGDAAGNAHSYLPVPAFRGTVPCVVWQDERAGDWNVHFNLPYGHVGYGAGLAGTGGIEPTLDGAGIARRGEPFAFPVAETVGGTVGVLGLGLQKVEVPVFGGMLLVDPIVLLGFATGGAPGVAGAGAATPVFVLPATPDSIGLGIFGQVFVFDAGAPDGFAMTNGLEVWIGS